MYCIYTLKNRSESLTAMRLYSCGQCGGAHRREQQANDQHHIPHYRWCNGTEHINTRLVSFVYTFLAATSILLITICFLPSHSLFFSAKMMPHIYRYWQRRAWCTAPHRTMSEGKKAIWELGEIILSFAFSRFFFSSVISRKSFLLCKFVLANVCKCVSACVCFNSGDRGADDDTNERIKFTRQLLLRSIQHFAGTNMQS